LLGNSFVNAWVLAKDLDGIAARSQDELARRMCALLKQNYDYPVDSVILSPDLKIRGQRDVATSMMSEPSAYAEFLRRALKSEESAEEKR
jgi:hypothetical protein